MKILSVDTSSSICSVCILENETVIKNFTIEDANTHSVNLMPLIEQSFNEANLSLNDINLLACDKGPGSFTGIRIGIATIKAFCDVTNIPAIGISSLRTLAYNSNYNGLICSLIDAKNDNVYFGLFDNSTNNYIKIQEYLFENINYVTEILKLCNKPIFFVGNGSIVYKDVLKSILNDNAIFPNNNDMHKLSSETLGKLAFNIFSNSKISEEYNLSPLYLRKSNAERELIEKQNEIRN